MNSGPGRSWHLTHLLFTGAYHGYGVGGMADDEKKASS